MSRVTARTSLRVLAAVLATSTAERAASAHLIAPRRATVHVVGDSVFSVVWLGASELKGLGGLEGVELDAEGLVHQDTLERHQTEVVRRLQERWRLRDGAEQADVARVDLVLQPPDDAPPDRGDRADQLVMLHHARFKHPPQRIELDTDLFDTAAGADLTVSASNDRAAETVTLRPPRARHVFFAGAAERSRSIRTGRAMAVGALAAALLATLIAGLVARRRRAALRTSPADDAS
jgi:hypothetical protein